MGLFGHLCMSDDVTALPGSTRITGSCFHLILNIPSLIHLRLSWWGFQQVENCRAANQRAVEALQKVNSRVWCWVIEGLVSEVWLGLFLRHQGTVSSIFWKVEEWLSTACPAQSSQFHYICKSGMFPVNIVLSSIFVILAVWCYSCGVSTRWNSGISRSSCSGGQWYESLLCCSPVTANGNLFCEMIMLQFNCIVVLFSYCKSLHSLLFIVCILSFMIDLCLIFICNFTSTLVGSMVQDMDPYQSL
jgi:hypothetical protein